MRRQLMALFLVLGALAAPVMATVLDFNSLGYSDNTSLPASTNYGGLVFVGSSGSGLSYYLGYGFSSTNAVYPTVGPNAYLTVKPAATGSTMDFTSVWLDDQVDKVGSSQLIVQGFRGGAVAITNTIDAWTTQTYSPSGYTNLDSLRFVATGDYGSGSSSAHDVVVTIDNFTYTLYAPVADTEKPVYSSTPANISVNTDAGKSYATVSWTTPTATDNISVASNTCSPVSNSQFSLGATTVTCTAKDAANNATSATFTVTVSDVEKPVLSGMSNKTANTDAGKSYAVVSWTAPTATDNVGISSNTCSPASASQFSVGATTVTCTVKDAANNATSTTFTVTVSDAEPPVLSGMPDKTVNTDASKSYATVSWTAPTVTDNVSSSLTATCSPVSASQFSVGATTVTCTAKDAANNATSTTFTVTVSDVEKPVLSSLSDKTVNTDAGKSYAVVSWTAPTATDNVGVSSNTCIPASGSQFAMGATTVSCSATDAASNATSVTFTVIVSDAEPPVLSGMSDKTVNTDAGKSYAVVSWTAPSVTDNVSSSLTATCSPASGSQFSVGATTVTCTAKDDANNNASSSFTVTVSDVEKPVLAEVPSDTIVGMDAGATSVAVTWTVTATDNVASAPVVSCTPASGSAFPLGPTAVTCSASDAAGNVATAMFNVVVRSSQTIDFAALQNVVYGASPFVLSGTASSSLSLTWKSSNTAVATVEGNTVTIVGAGSTEITADQAGSTDYAPASLSRTLTVLPIELHLVGAAATNKKYDGTNVAAVTQTGLDNAVLDNDEVKLVVGQAMFSDAKVGTDKAITLSGYELSGAQATNYYLTVPTDLKAAITVASLTITAKSDTIFVGESDPAFDFGFSGFVNGEGKSVLTGLTATRVAGTKAGSYDITPSATSSNYKITVVKGTLVILPKPTSVVQADFAASLGEVVQVAGGVRISGLRGTAEVFSASGVRVASLNVDSDGEYRLALPAAGMHVMRIGNQSWTLHLP